MGKHMKFAPGMIIELRDEQWRIVRVDLASSGAEALRAVGITELVRNKESLFLSDMESSIRILDPALTTPAVDASPRYQAALTYLESQLRRKPPTDEALYVGHQAAMDVVDYQMDPAGIALRQPRQRILIADAVGLGKTMECGILLAELIRRGRGRRILVVALKSMLVQLQKELWCRFAIPLVRLDSLGLQRIQARMPANHNPFHYFDKTIVSIDTLKQNNAFHHYIEQASWDIIVIDEAHNVARRAQGGVSLRHRLAGLLAGRSDTLIMLSATPHDGRARSFASLMNMLDPTAIADPDNYTKDDIKGLYIRRFKKDIAHMVPEQFPEREIARAAAAATAAEEAAFAELAALEFTRLDHNRSGNLLFKTTLEKALFSSPAACLASLRERVKRLERRQDAAQFADDISTLNRLGELAQAVTPDQFSKYQKLLAILADRRHPFGWTGRAADDRLVIFTERIETLKYLAQRLKADLDLADKHVATIHGGLPDNEITATVESFGQETSPIRLLLASDIAAEGINLHYMCHRMIHFDIPWSLMVFQQRNGRIDRYGQTRTPRILYLLTTSQNAKIRGDMRVLELLTQKDEQAARNIGDPSALMGVYDIELEERITADIIESGRGEAELEARLAGGDAEQSLLDNLFGSGVAPDEPPPARGRMPSLFPDDFSYAREALDLLQRQNGVQCRVDAAARQLELSLPDDLAIRFQQLPDEVRPDNGRVLLSADKIAINAAISDARKAESSWPRIHYLWELHPVMDWLNDRMAGNFGRHSAPVIVLDNGLQPGETVVLLSALLPNRKSHPLVHRWFGASFFSGAYRQTHSLEQLIDRTGLGRRPLPNRGTALDPAPF